MKTNKKVTISMKKYIKPEIEIMLAAPANLMGTSLNSSNASAFTDANKGETTDINIISDHDEVVDGDIGDASKRWNDWGDQSWTGYSPW